jgi:hypothetical protein
MLAPAPCLATTLYLRGTSSVLPGTAFPAAAGSVVGTPRISWPYVESDDVVGPADAAVQALLATIADNTNQISVDWAPLSQLRFLRPFADSSESQPAEVITA